jgi:succinylglutamate desuccinylase
MQGVFFTSKSPPPMIRDELLYNSRFKDSLEQEIGEVEAMKKHEKTQRTQQTQQPIDQYMSEKARSTSNNEEFHLRYRKNEVLDKVNHIPMDGAL